MEIIGEVRFYLSKREKKYEQYCWKDFLTIWDVSQQMAGLILHVSFSLCVYLSAFQVR